VTLATLLVLATFGPQAPPPQAPPPTESAMEAPASSLGGAQSAIDAGLLAYRKRQFAKAEASFQRAMDSDPTSAAAAFYLGYTVYKRAEGKGHHNPGKARAAQLFAKAYELDPAFRPVWARAKK
jgi:hypothetical protein